MNPAIVTRGVMLVRKIAEFQDETKRVTHAAEQKMGRLMAEADAFGDSLPDSDEERRAIMAEIERRVTCPEYSR